MHTYDIVDFHTHIYPAKIAHKAVDAISQFYSIPMSGQGTSEHLLQEGSKIGVSRYVVHSVATTPMQVVSINDFIAKETQAHPEFIGFATLHPGFEDIASEVDRVIDLGLRGIKVHPDFQEFNIDDEAAMKIYRAIEGRLPILFHMGDKTRDFSAPRRLRAILDRFPNLVVIGAHFGGYNAWDESKKYLLDQNIYFDTSSSLFCLSPEEAAQMIRAHGTEKMLFGTDYPMWDHEQELARFLALPLTEEERIAILGKNARRLLQI